MKPGINPKIDFVFKLLFAREANVSILMALT